MIYQLRDIKNIEVKDVDDLPDYSEISIASSNELVLIHLHKSMLRKFVKKLVRNLLDADWKFNIKEI